MTKPLLTVGIPTWNRCNDISTAIDSVLCQLDGDLYRQVEILVSDNASTDDTPRLLAKYREQHPDLFVINRNAENIGFSRNVDTLFRQASGEYVLVLSDDDALEPDAIGEIMNLLREQNTASIIVVPASSYTETLAAPKNPGLWARERAEKQPAYYHFASGIEYYRAIGSLCHVCISGNMFKVAAWRSIDMRAGLSSGSVQLHAAIQLHARGSSCMMRRPLVKYRDSIRNARTGGFASGFPFVYHFDIVEACRNGQNLYPAAIYRSFYLKCVRGVFYTLLEAKAYKYPINKGYFLARLDTCFDRDYCGWLIPAFRLLLKMPPFMLFIPHHLYRLGQKSYFYLRARRPGK